MKQIPKPPSRKSFVLSASVYYLGTATIAAIGAVIAPAAASILLLLALSMGLLGLLAIFSYPSAVARYREKLKPFEEEKEKWEALIETVRRERLAVQVQAEPPQKQPPELPSMSGDTRAKFERAKEMIQAKQYEQARNLLKTIDHPTAKDWLSKLDRIKV